MLLLTLAASAARAQFAPIGLSSVRAQAFFNEEIDGFPPQAGDEFGKSLAAGDFNGDGAMDLATGMPFDNGPTDLPLVSAGAVVIRWGSVGGVLSATQSPTVLSLFASGGQAQAHTGDLFGWALAVGDFNGDGRDDLAVGIPRYSSGPDFEDTWIGAVQIHYGEPFGIQLAGEHFLSTADPQMPNPPGDLDHLGYALAAGDFDGDGYSDLAIGAPVGSGGGGVVVLHGGSGGLMPIVGYLIHQGDPQVPDTAEAPDDFGFALAAGNFNGDFRFTDRGVFAIDDLAMSAPGEDGVGAVMVMQGSEFGLIFANSVYLGRGDLGGVGEADAQFGHTLAAGNFDGDANCFLQIWCFAIDDLAIGTPFEDLGAGNANADAGEVSVLYGSTVGFFDLARTDHLTQGTVFGSAAYDQAGDQFGFALAAGDFDRDGREDLAIGQPGEDVGGGDRGGVTILMGGAGGLYERYRFLAAGINGVQPGPQDNSLMGRSLAVGDFNGNGFSDLAIGIPSRDQTGVANLGAESILYGALFADGFASGNDWHWSESVP